jgi:pyruvate dehydrogenase E2 component (dihydrolipoamide acetyltransferase)
MAIEIIVPRLGWSMEEGTLTEWLKAEGEFVRKGDMLFVLEGDKAAQDIECFDEGILRFLPGGPRAGDVVKVGQVIAVLLAENESPAPVAEQAKPQIRAAIPAPASPSARRQARKHQLTAAPVQVSPPQPAPTARHRSSPRARRRAQELGIDWKNLDGSGNSGRVVERDVLASGPRRTEPADTRIPHSATRRTIASRMLASHHATAPVTLTTTADATNLVNLRNQFRAQSDANLPAPGYSDLIAKLTALVLVEFPALNARWEDDACVQFSCVHLGIAVDTEAGLIVPVIRDTERLPLRELVARSKDLVARAHDRRLTADELQGGTFTISNLGAYGIDAFTPIINGPQCAILGLGRIRQVPVCVAGQVVPRDQITLSLTFDHRLVDGGPAARFLQALVHAIENPAARLID